MQMDRSTKGAPDSRRPYHFGRADHEYCMACWLGVGPNDTFEFLSEDLDESAERVGTEG